MRADQDPEWVAANELLAMRASLGKLYMAMRASGMLESLVVQDSVIRLGFEVLTMRNKVLARL
jgi:hypothetical protein